MAPELTRRKAIGLGGAIVGSGLLGASLTGASGTESTIPIFVENRTDSEHTFVIIIDDIEEVITKTVTVAPGKRSLALRVPEGQFGLTAEIQHDTGGFAATSPSPEEDFYTKAGFFVVAREPKADQDRRVWIQNSSGDRPSSR